MTDPAKLWSDVDYTNRLAELSWMSALAVQLHLNERATGDPARDWLTAWAPRFFAGEHLRVLVLGCGDGWLERALARHDFIERIDACDFAADAVERARAQAPAKVSYSVCDLNRDELPPDAYDVIVAHSVLHHVERLEHAFDQIERALKSGGTLIVNEYVGPRRFQYGDDVLAIINELLAALPPELRRSALTGEIYESKQRPTVEEMIANDPSEAVRSDELLPMLDARFEVIDRRDLGGMILQHLLYDIVQNFRFDDARARSYLEMLCVADAALPLPSDYVLLAARKRGAPKLRERRVTLPPLPPEGRLRMRDPLWSVLLSEAKDLSRRKKRPLAPLGVTLLRIALLGSMPNRTPLNPRSRIAEWLARRLDPIANAPEEFRPLLRVILRAQ